VFVGRRGAATRRAQDIELNPNDLMLALVSVAVLLGAFVLILGDSSQDNQKWACETIGSIVGHWLKGHRPM